MFDKLAQQEQLFKQQKVQLCYYCAIKSKMSGYKHYCLEHTMQNKYKNDFNKFKLSDIISHLQNIEQTIDKYWQYVKTISFNETQFQQSLDSIIPYMERIVNKIDPFKEYLYHYKSEMNSNTLSFRESIQPSELTIISENNVENCVQEWVMHYYKILKNQQIEKQTLPFQASQAMSLFKQSMQQQYKLLIHEIKFNKSKQSKESRQSSVSKSQNPQYQRQIECSKNELKQYTINYNLINKQNDLLYCLLSQAHTIQQLFDQNYNNK